MTGTRTQPRRPLPDTDRTAGGRGRRGDRAGHLAYPLAEPRAGAEAGPVSLDGFGVDEFELPGALEATAPPEERGGSGRDDVRLLVARRAGSRVVAVGTTAVRALESACDESGVLRAASGWTELVITPERGVRVVDGLLTGLHEPRASHLLMLEAVAGRPLLDRSYAEALRERYPWHEFGDLHLLLDR